jgi:5-methylcytosine-specific restriction endonuclease McrA
VRGYDATWAKLANMRRRYDCYLCQECQKDDRLTGSKIVDHIVPVHVRPDWRLVLENTQVLCAKHHQQKTARDTEMYGSSAATQLSPEQQENFRRAKALAEPPRSGENAHASWIG